MSQKGRKSRPKAARYQEFPMYDRRLVAAGAALGLVALAAIAFVAVAPRVAVGGLTALAQQQLGRSIAIHGGTHLEFSPLAVRVEDAVLAGPNADDDSFIIAPSATVPVSFGQLFGARARPSSITLTGAEIALLIDERGQASWDFAGLAPVDMTLRLEQSRLRYFDARNSQSMTLETVDGTLSLRADGGAGFVGTAVINDRLVRIDADLKSLARINADGSPLELSLSANDGMASFSGRLATAQVLSLAGPISLSSTTPVAGLRLIGLPVPVSTVIAGPLAIDGGLDSAGRAFAIRNATLSLGSVQGVGDMAVDLRNDQPLLQGSLAMDTLWLDGFVPASGAKNGDWGRASLPFALLRNIDAALSLKARRLVYAGLTTGPASLGVTLKGGKLETVIAAELSDTGSAQLTVTADATTLPPAVGFKLDAQGVAAQPLLGALTGAGQITGTGDLVADLTATGTTQEELAGTLKGTARVGLASGRIAGVDLSGLFLAAKHKILDGWSAAPGDTAYDSLNGDATVDDGIATFRELTLVSPALTVTAGGILDVLRQGLALSATATVNGQPLLPVPVIARGLWGNPKIYPDIPDILSNPEGGFARLQDVPALQGN
jgi:uncharacterized protein involved in outer membrane biogenesis